MKTLVMLPTYNEKDNIAKIVDKILELPDTGIVIVDDDSPDGTGNIADALAKERGEIFVVHRKERGRGTAGVVGLKKCLDLGADYVIEMDADLSHDTSYIPVFMKEIQDCDVVLGSRFVNGGEDAERGTFRKIITRISRLVHAVGLRVKIKDMGSGFKCYRASALKAVNLDNFVARGGPGICIELNYKIARAGLKIKEYPIKFTDRKKGSSKLRMKDIMEALVLVAKINLGKVK